ncbi:MAG: prohibitin family protein [Oscillospiraceae bacterium]|nr:prohibitin family protein [Oscillospiraceae bacterium]
MEYKMEKLKNKKKLIFALIVAAVVIALGAFSVVVVPAGHTGVQVTLGAVGGDVLQEGMHFKVPFVTNIVVMDNRVLKTEVECSSASKDLQTVSSTIALNYRVGRENSASIYKNVGTNFEAIIVNPAIQECVKSVTAKYTAEELITERQRVGDQMKEALREKITPYGLDIEVFNIISFEFSEEFNAAIEAKQTAQQNALKAEQDLARIKVEAEQKVEQARAEAEAYRLKNEQITDQTLMMEWISKWDGKLPAVAGEGGYMFDVSGFLNGSGSGASNTTPSN